MTDVMDIYESRTRTEPSTVARQDCVLWPGREQLRALTPAQMQHFAERGFLFLRSFFSPEEVAIFREELDCMRADPALQKMPECIRESSSGEVRSIFNIHRVSPLFAALASDSRIVNAASQVLGSDVYMHQSRINLKPGFRGEPFYWHSDFETWHIEDGMPRMRAVSCSISLTANNRYNGPLMVMPGSHRDYIACIGKTVSENYKQSLRKQETGVPDDDSLTRLVDKYGIVAPTGPAGSVLLFDCNLMHGSSSNLTPWPRSNVFFVFNSMDNQIGQPAGGLEPRPEFVASREPAALQSRACDYKALVRGWTDKARSR
jgi:ectoine hydroxylase